MSNRFSVATERFEGPLETLLNLIEERKMPVSEVSLSQVCDAYLAYVEKLPELPLGETAQFILVASTLLLIKSRTLLPMLELSADERESVDELERRLARYAIIRTASKMLRKEWGRAPLLFPRRAPARAITFAPSEASVATLLKSAERLLSLLPKPEAVVRAAVAPILALEDVIVQLKNRLSSAIRTRFSELIKTKGKDEVIVYFLAMLELVRSGSASVSQDKLFEEIEMEIESVAAPRYGT